MKKNPSNVFPLKKLGILSILAKMQGDSFYISNIRGRGRMVKAMDLLFQDCYPSYPRVAGSNRGNYRSLCRIQFCAVTAHLGLSCYISVNVIHTCCVVVYCIMSNLYHFPVYIVLSVGSSYPGRGMAFRWLNRAPTQVGLGSGLVDSDTGLLATL